jgi:A/G-specific adenine glycosylase
VVKKIQIESRHMKEFVSLMEWFESEKRSLPWRNDPSPYAVWISEIMLQQTQVSVVLPYFQRWMTLFPTIDQLAKAPLDTVIKAWEGLGYYSRARNLHAGAQYIVEHFGGELPSDAESLAKIKGIGPYTVGAIRSFAFHQKAAAVDGNVIRVLARYFNLQEDVSKPNTIKKIWELAETILPEKQPWVLVEALIELGATICSKKPQCEKCPLRSSCSAYMEGNAPELPIKSGKIQNEKLYRAVAVITSTEGKTLVKRVQKGKIMSDLHEFPYFETSSTGMTSQLLSKQILKTLGLKAVFRESLPSIQHSFTRYQVSLFPMAFDCQEALPVEDYQWMLPVELEQVAFSSGHRRLKKLL